MLWWPGALVAAAIAACDPPRGDRVNTPARASAAPCRPARTAAQLVDAIAREVGDAPWVMSESFTPPLPTRWPNASGGGIVFLTYRFSPLPTGRVISRVRGPMHKIEFPALDAAPIIQTLDDDALGDVDDSIVADDDRGSRLAAAAEVLIEIVSGCREERDAHTALAPYVTWLRENGPVAKDLAARMPTFITWLRGTQ